MNIAYPFHIDRYGRTASTDDAPHIRDMLEQLIFTNPGERVNRPDFGSGLLQLVFKPNSPELAATIQYTTQAAIQRWLGDLILLQSLTVTSDDGTLTVVINYVIRQTNTPQSQTFVRPIGAS